MTDSPEKLHVLLADDDSDDSMLFGEALEQSDIPVEFSRAEDGNQLLRVLEEGQKPDILFLDVNMPYKNGIECLQTIRSQRQFENLPIIIYSTTNYRVNIDACYEGGANLYVVKPSTFDDIKKMVRKLCNRDWVINTPRSPDSFLLNTFE